MFARPNPRIPVRHARRLVVLALLLLVGVPMQALVVPPVLAAENPSGLPLPRFATTRSTPINVRLGPGTKYDVAWVYVKAGVPVEIVQEFDTWRKIRDFDGSEGWVHQNLLSGKRAGLVAPWRSGEQVPLRARDAEDAGVRAWLGNGFRVEISSCNGKWCSVIATTTQNGKAATYSGYLPQANLWGAYENEEFN